MAWLQALTGLIEQMQVRGEGNLLPASSGSALERLALKSMHLSQTGPQGPGVSSCGWGVDQWERNHEVVKRATSPIKAVLIYWIPTELYFFFFVQMCVSGRSQTKDIFNSQFGSLFRTYHNPTYFSRRLSRFADIYMASISCLLNYDLQHTFFPRRTPLQHESSFGPEHSPIGGTFSPQLDWTQSS